MPSRKLTKSPRICAICGQEFFPHASVKWRPLTGRFCSRACANVSRAIPVADKIRNNTKLTASGCLVWTGFKQNGYGCISIHNHGYYAHRIVWKMAHGAIPNGLHVCHHCDNPSCINIDHLFLGTPADNHHDCMSKNRQAKGEMVPSAKLTSQTVVEARKRFSDGENFTSIAKSLGVTREAISRVIKRINWKHV